MTFFKCFFFCLNAHNQKSSKADVKTMWIEFHLKPLKFKKGCNLKPAEERTGHAHRGFGVTWTLTRLWIYDGGPPVLGSAWTPEATWSFAAQWETLRLPARLVRLINVHSIYRFHIRCSLLAFFWVQKNPEIWIQRSAPDRFLFVVWQ